MNDCLVPQEESWLMNLIISSPVIPSPVSTMHTHFHRTAFHRTAAEVVGGPVDISDDLAGLASTQYCLDGVLRRLAEILGGNLPDRVDQAGSRRCGLTSNPCNSRQPGSVGRERRAGSPAGHQRRKRGAVGYTAVQAVAAVLLASGMGNTVTATGPRPRLRSSGNSTHC